MDTTAADFMSFLVSLARDEARDRDGWNSPLVDPTKTAFANQFFQAVRRRVFSHAFAFVVDFGLHLAGVLDGLAFGVAGLVRTDRQRQPAGIHGGEGDGSSARARARARASACA